MPRIVTTISPSISSSAVTATRRTIGIADLELAVDTHGEPNLGRREGMPGRRDGRDRDGARGCRDGVPQVPASTISGTTDAQR